MSKKIPFDFVLDYLLPREVEVKLMFGMFAIYAGEKIMLILRERNQHPESNGIWVAVGDEQPENLRTEFPSLTSIPDLPHRRRPQSTEWLLLPAGSMDFESTAVTLCKLIATGDRRIGHIPKSRRSR